MVRKYLRSPLHQTSGDMDVIQSDDDKKTNIRWTQNEPHAMQINVVTEESMLESDSEDEELPFYSTSPRRTAIYKSI